MKKRILYFMPDNPVSGKAGNLTRCLQMLDYFEQNHKSMHVDFASAVKWEEWSHEDLDRFQHRFPNLGLQFLRRKIPLKNILPYLFYYKLPNLLAKFKFRNNHIDQTTFFFRKQMRKLINEHKYDVVIISYSSWGKLIDARSKDGPYYIVDTHDFMTSQLVNKEGFNVGHSLGADFQKEIEILSKFDEIWTYSVEEQYIYEQFSNRLVRLLPVSVPTQLTTEINNSFKYDLIYVASDNPHNIKSINWFMRKVFPLLEGVKLCIVGQICNEVDDYPNVVKLGLVENLSRVYQQSRISVCPMLSGTGVKIKVLEAMSHALPVVTTRRGVDGLLNKLRNGCLVSECAEQFASHIRLLIKDEKFYQKISKEGNQYFKENHYKEKEDEFLDSIFSM